MLEEAKKEEAELHIQFNELAGFTGLTCCVVTVFLIILTCYCIVKLSTKSGDTGFSVEAFMYIFPLLYGTHVGLEGYVSWKNNLIIKQIELKGSRKVFVTFERYSPGCMLGTCCGGESKSYGLEIHQFGYVYSSTCPTTATLF